MSNTRRDKDTTAISEPQTGMSSKSLALVPKCGAGARTRFERGVKMSPEFRSRIPRSDCTRELIAPCGFPRVSWREFTESIYRSNRKE